MRDLAPGFTSSVDTVDERSWSELLARFEDASIYQTWSYDAVRCGAANISHLVLKRDDAAVAVAQARIVRVPFLPIGIAYVRWGPLWRLRGTEPHPDIVRQAIRALRNEYACKRGFQIRLNPHIFDDGAFPFRSLLEEEGFRASSDERDRTILIDLTRSLEALRAGMRPHWRRQLKAAEKNDLEIIEGTDDGMFDAFVAMYREMVSRKGFPEPNDINEFRLIQRQLAEGSKMRILLCRASGVLCAGLICSVAGDTGVYLFGATSDAGLTHRGAYLLHWRMIQWLKDSGCSTYDLHGINPQRNPGGYRFKNDLLGENGKDLHFLGRFDSYENRLSHWYVSMGEAIRTWYRRMRQRMGTGPNNQSAVKVAEG
jgi:lipid II:glycine glycyltransferase (peptidoglycan interpeptide bridge formation enzyme)